jgi:hypothetical protein
MEMQINYEKVREDYKRLNEKFKKLETLSKTEKESLLKDLTKLNSTLSKNPEIVKKLEKDENIILLDQNNKYIGSRLKIMAYWIRRGEMNKEVLKIRDENLALLEFINEPELRKRQKKTLEAIENLRNAQIEENAANTNIRKFYLDIIDIYKESIEIAKKRNMKYSGMLEGMADAERFNNFIVSQIDLSLAALSSKELAKMIYQYRKIIFKEKLEYSEEEIKQIKNLAVAIKSKINQTIDELKYTESKKQEYKKMLEDIASRKKEVPLELLNKFSEQWKKFIPQAKLQKENAEIELNSLNLALSALNRLESAARA